MATNGGQPVADNDDLDTRFNRRFQRFVVTFVSYFEDKLDQYCKTSEGKLQKISKRGTVLEFFVSAVFAGFGVFVGSVDAMGKVGKTGGRLLGKYFGSKHHTEKANQIHANVGLAAAETVKLRATLVETAAEIFRTFEMQFMTMECEKGWHIAMQDLAQEAVERIINYTHKNPIIAVTSEVLTKALLLGKPKPKIPLDSTPHKVIFQGVCCKISKFYDKACLRIHGNPDRFYKREGAPNNVAMKYGYRLLFKWEDRTPFEFEKFEPKSPVDYIYLLQDEETGDKKMIEILDTINNSDPNFKLNAIHKGLDNWMMKILNNLNSVLEEIKKSQAPLERTGRPTRGGFVFNLLQPVESFIGRDRLLGDGAEGIHHALSEKKIVTIVGPGGIGKTELAKKFATKFKISYDGNVIWINCSNQGNMTMSFRRLANRLSEHSPCTAEHQEWRCIPFFVLQVHAFFKNKKCLFVFDDVEQFSEVQDFLPPRTSAGSHVLMTSRNKRCGQGFHTFPLTPFTEVEAMEFLHAELKTAQGPLQEDKVVMLARVMGNSPLSLHLAAVCVKEKRDGSQSNCPISDYLEGYGREDTEDDNAVNGAISRSLKAIENEGLGQNALKMIKVIAFFFPENVPGKIFSNLFLDENELSYVEFEDILQLLRKYSVLTLMSTRSPLLSIRSRIQEYVRQSLSDEDHREVLQQALLCLRVTTAEEHAMVVWDSATKYPDLVNQFLSYSNGVESNSILHLLAKNGHIRTMAKLLSAIVDEGRKVEFINSQNKSGNTAVHLAAKNGFLNIVKYLERQQADLTLKNKTDRLPFHECIVKGQLHVVKYFAEQYDCTSENEDNLNLVCWAAASGNIQVLQYLIEEQNVTFLKRGTARSLPLHEACKRNKLDIVEYLLDQPGADADVRDIERNTPLHFAAQYGHLDLVRFLIEVKMVEVMPKNMYSKTPAHCAVKSGRVDVVKYFMNNEQMIFKDKYSLLHEAAYNGKLQILKLFAKEYPHKLPVNSKDGYGNTPLHEASCGGNIDVVRYLVESHQATVDVKNSHGKLPIHRAAINGKLYIVKYFLEDQKVPVDVLDGEECTPLHEATYGGRLDIVRLLVENDAHIEKVNRFKRTPLFGAVKNGHLAVVKYLVGEKDCQTDVKDHKGKIPLQIAEEKGHHEVVEYLKGRLNAN